MQGLKRTFQVINEMVADGVIRKYAVTGAIATLNYLEPTETEDLDILVSIDHFSTESGLATLGPIPSYLQERGYSDWRMEGVVIEGWPVQFIPVADALDAEGLDEAVEVELEPTDGEGRESRPIKIRTLRAEHLVAIALRTFRPKDRDRIIRFVEEKAVELERLRNVLKGIIC